MKICPYCKEEVREDALKCRFCHSTLTTPDATAAPTNDDRHVTYVLDKDLVRFAKFAAAVLAVLVVAGAYLFGFKLESSVERLGTLQEEVEKTSQELTQSQADLRAAKATVRTLKAEVESVLAQAKATLGDIGKQRELAIEWVVSIKELTPTQQRALAQIKTAETNKARKSGKYWAVGTSIRVGFLDGTPDQRAFVRQTIGEWIQHANLAFSFVDAREADVRVSFDSALGSWSFLGTDALAIPKGKATVNLGWLHRNNVLHEFGHVLGLIEEFQNPNVNTRWDKKKLVEMIEAQGWSRQEIEVLIAPVAADELGAYRDFDPQSIMMAFDLPAALTGGVKVGGAVELSQSDKALVRRLYPGKKP